MASTTFNFKTFIFTACATCSIVAAQATPPGSATPAAADASGSFQLSSSNLAFEPVGPGDLVYLSVTGSPELSHSYRVAADGTISLPLLTQNIHIAGLLAPAIADTVTKELVREHVLVAPIVSASVLDYRSRLVSIVGSVHLPTTVEALGNMRLLDAIARAQGISPDAGPEIIISKTGVASNSAAADSNDIQHISVKALLAGTDPSLNILLHGGEEIRVPEAPKLYVVGNVKTPGTYPLTDLEGSSVLKVLAQSQGVLSFTAREAFVYRVVPGSKDRQEIEIQLNKILHRKSPDFPLEANDILYIPDNNKMRVSASVLEHMAGFGSSTASSLIVWH